MSAPLEDHILRDVWQLASETLSARSRLQIEHDFLCHPVEWSSGEEPCDRTCRRAADPVRLAALELAKDVIAEAEHHEEEPAFATFVAQHLAASLKENA